MARAKVSKTPSKSNPNDPLPPASPDSESAQAARSETESSGPGPLETFAAGATTLLERNGGALLASPGLANGHTAGSGAKTQSPETTEKIKELLRLAQEQGYLTYGDINEALPDTVASPEEIERIIIQLRNLEVEIVDQAEVDRVKQPDEEEDEKTRLDVLDDPVRMYLKQMGQVALLTREQEVEISKRIEDAEEEIQKIICGFGFAGKE